MKKILLLSVAVIAAAGLFLSATFKEKEKKRAILTKGAPQPIGPYSQAILAGNTLYISGQVGINPVTNKLDSTGIEGEARQALQNIYSILLEADMNMTNIVKASVYLRNVKDFEKMNKVYGSYFTNMVPPARETIGVADLPKGANIEISVIAVK